jgi:hypothetical protein
MYLRCPRQYEFRYVQDLKIPPGLALVGGSSVHTALEGNYTKKLKTQEDIALDEFVGIFRDTFDEKRDEMVSTPREEVSTYTQNTERCLEIYHEGYAPQIMPDKVELELTAKVDGTEILGYLDLITDTQIVVDHKTSSKSPYHDVADKSPQLSMYEWLCMENGIETAGLRLDYLVAKKEPCIVQLETERQLEDLDFVVRMMGDVIKGIEKEVFPPNPTSFLCSPKYCGYWERCRG